MSRTDQLKVAMVGRAAGGYDAHPFA